MWTITRKASALVAFVALSTVGAATASPQDSDLLGNLLGGQDGNLLGGEDGNLLGGEDGNLLGGEDEVQPVNRVKDLLGLD